MDVVGIAFVIPVILLSLVMLGFAYRARSDTRRFGIVCGFAGVTLGIVKILMYTGRIDGEGALYWTLNISLSGLFFVMLLGAIYTAHKRQQRLRS
jgi:hypothetical protein